MKKQYAFAWVFAEQFEVKVLCALDTEWPAVILVSLILCFALVLGEMNNYTSKGGKKYFKAEANSVQC